MRVRLPIAAAFAVVAVASLYLGFADVHLVHDKAAHFTAFFLLGVTFYWIFDVPRRRALNLSLIAVVLIGGAGSEVAQGLLTARQFDLHDILANVLGSSLAIGLSALYHQRLLDRRRKARYDRLRQNLADDVEAQVGSAGPEIELQEVAAASKPSAE